MMDQCVVCHNSSSEFASKLLVTQELTEHHMAYRAPMALRQDSLSGLATDRFAVATRGGSNCSVASPSPSQAVRVVQSSFPCIHIQERGGVREHQRRSLPDYVHHEVHAGLRCAPVNLSRRSGSRT